MTLETGAQSAIAAGDRPLVVIAGPTASGKTALAVEIAVALGGEIVSADSMQVYDCLPLLTARPTEAELRGVPIHLSGHIQPSDQYNAQRFVTEADGAIAAIRSRGALPIVVGGTGLYIRALLKGLFDGPAVDPKLRGELESQASTEAGLLALRDELAGADPAAAARIQPADTVRLVRALEVWRSTGTPISQLQQQFGRRGARHPHRLVILEWPTQALDARIRKRAESMIAHGLKQEVSAYLDSGGAPEHPAYRALGADLVARHIRGQLSESEMLEGLVTCTRQYAKRQRTWFRKEAADYRPDLSNSPPSEVFSAIQEMLAHLP